MIAAMILFSLNFFFFVPDFTCTDEEMVGFDTCEDYVCSLDDENFWISHFEQPVPNSIALDYGITMVCSKAWLSSLLQSMSYLGSLFGYIIMSHVGDNIGRKKGELVSWIICIIGQIIMLASFNLYMVAVGSILLGFGANAAITLHYSFFK
jgi:MFS family permease